MIQLKKILYSKSVILLLLFSTTTSTGFVQDENRTNRDIGNVREHRLSIDRQLENSQNLPIRNADLDRQINQKDKVVERVYDRRSFRTGTIDRNSDIRDVRDINNNQRETLRNFPNDGRNSISRDSILAARNIAKGTRQGSNEREDKRITPNFDRRQTRGSQRVNRVLGDQQNQRLNVRQITNRRLMENDPESRSTRNIRQTNEDNTSQSLSRRQLSARVIHDRDHRLSERRDLDQSQRRISIRSTALVSERRNNDENDRSERRSTTRFVDNRERRTQTRNLDQNRVPIEETFTRTLGNQNRVSERSDTNRRSIENNRRQYSDELTRRQVNTITREDRIGTPKSDRYGTRSVDRKSIERYGMEKSEDRSRDRRENLVERRVVDREARTQDSRQDLRRSTRQLSRRVSERRDLEQDRLMRRERRERTNDFRRNSFEARDQARTRSRSVTMANRERRSVSTDAIERSRVAERRPTTERQERRISEEDSRRYSFRLDHMARVTERSRSDSTRKIRNDARNLLRDSRVSDQRDNQQRQDRYTLTSDSRRYFARLVSERTTRTSERDTGALGLVKNVDYLQFGSSLWVEALKAALAVFLIGQILANSSKTKKYGYSTNLISMMKSIKQKVE